MPNLDKVAFHEVSHVITAKLFEDYVILSRVTLSTDEVDNEMALAGTDAGTCIRTKAGVNRSCDAYAIIVWAGFIGQNIYLNDRDFICKKKFDIMNNPNILDTGLISGDLKIFNALKETNSKNKNMTTIQYQEWCLKFLIEYLTGEKVWYWIRQLAKELMSKPNLTLETEELNSFFESSGYGAFVRSVKDTVASSLGLDR